MVAEPDITMILADYAAVADGKLVVVGAGWNVNRAPAPCSIGGLLKVPWSTDEASHSYHLVLELVDEDGQPFMILSDDGNRMPLRAAIDIALQQPPGVPMGVGVNYPFAFNFGPVPYERPKRYTWQLYLDGDTKDAWRASFIAIEMAQQEQAS